MSRQVVRAAVAAFLQPPNVAGLNHVWTSKPKDLGAVSYTQGQPPGTANGALGMVSITGQEERPITLDGAGGGRLVTYQVQVEIFHRSIEPTAEAAMGHFDSVVDGLCSRLRSDPSLAAANPAIISSAHESLAVEFGEPELATPDGGAVDTWAAVRFPVLSYERN